jgi:hypothetical protein
MRDEVDDTVFGMTDSNLLAPVFDVVEYEDVQFSNTFYQPSPYRGKPTLELEKSWSDLWKSQ